MADFDLLIESAEAALNNQQLQPVLKEYKLVYVRDSRLINFNQNIKKEQFILENMSRP